MPPLFSINTNQTTSKIEKESEKEELFSFKLKKISDELEEAVPMSNDHSNNVLVGSNSYKKKSLSKSKKRIDSYNNEIYS